MPPGGGHAWVLEILLSAMLMCPKAINHSICAVKCLKGRLSASFTVRNLGMKQFCTIILLPRQWTVKVEYKICMHCSKFLSNKSQFMWYYCVFIATRVHKNSV